MAHPDILADPTKALEEVLTAEVDCESSCFAAIHPDAQECIRAIRTACQLHRHILAGGALPAQWRGEGTETSEDKLRAEHETESGAALAELAHGVTAAAGLLSRNGFETMADLLRRRLAAVTGED